jgi:uncharacterized membrane protein (UPF0127 family)
MIITNKTRGTVVSEDAREARSFVSRVKGLMLTTKPQTLVLVNPHSDIEGASIHMWFMRQPIDVIWVNEKMKVVSTLESARPWALRIFRPRLSSKYVIECPIGTIKKTKTEEGDTFSFPKT